MRFLYRRPQIKDVRNELNMVMDVLSSGWFIMLDLFWYCIIFTIFLFPFLHSILVSIIFFAGTFVFFNCLYFFFFKVDKTKSLDI